MKIKNSNNSDKNRYLLLKKELLRFIKIVNTEMEAVFDNYLKKNKSTVSKEMIGLLKEFCLRGGKRTRSILTYYGYRCVKPLLSTGNPSRVFDELLKVCVAMELVHAYFLIHDDIIDRDGLRRNKPTMNKTYQDIFQKRFRLSKHESVHFGNSMAILAGDLANSLAHQIILSTRFSPEKKSKVLLVINNIIEKTIYGEYLDVFSCIKDINEKDTLEISRLKTAVYSFEMPLTVGALLADARIGLIDSLKQYSNNIGIAYQIQDDILGLFGDQDKIGKPIGSDLKEGKQTILIVKALNRLKKDKKTLKRFMSMLGKADITQKDIDYIRKNIIKTGSLDYSKKLIKRFSKKAIRAIEKNIEPTAKHFLFDLAKFPVESDYSKLSD